MPPNGDAHTWKLQIKRCLTSEDCVCVILKWISNQCPLRQVSLVQTRSCFTPCLTVLCLACKPLGLGINLHLIPVQFIV